MSLSLVGAAHAALTDVSQVPLQVPVSATPVKPNLLFVLDDSGSMDWNFLPEAAYYLNGQYGIRAAQCNSLAFDPNQAYTPPLDANGSSRGNADISTVLNATTGLVDIRSTSYSYMPLQSSGAIILTVYPGALPTDAYVDANGLGKVGEGVTIFDANDASKWMSGIVASYDPFSGQMQVVLRLSSGTGNLGTASIGVGWPPFVYFNYSGSDPRLAYSYDTSGNLIRSGQFYDACFSVVGQGSGASVFSMQRITAASPTTVKQSLANWWAYYGTRMKMMKTVTSQAFKNIDQRYRVGFTTIMNTTAQEVPGDTNFLHIRDFNAGQKSNFYNALNNAIPGGATPLRGALAKAGQYFAYKAPAQNLDPVQYACQKNYTILATDGAWNIDNETFTYGPVMLDGVTTVGQQDGTAARPYKDASLNGGSSNSLADVAMYYYTTDLRTAALSNCTGAVGTDVCANNVKPVGRDTATWQHMTTFTLNLGQNGTLRFQDGYETQASGDYADVKNGLKDWPNPVSDATKVDDLWHAAVNGRGTYFNASDPSAVSRGLEAALSQIDNDSAKGSAVGTSSLRPSVGNNQAFVGSFTTGLWTGDVKAYRIDTATGALISRDANGNDLADWSAAARLRNNTSRRIFYAKPGTGLREFTVANLTTDGYLADFNNTCARLSQCASLSAADQAVANSATNLVSYLRGNAVSVFRSRGEVLGDIVNSTPTFVGAPPFSHADAGYSAFKTAQANRAGVVYVGANDGMLHAFNAATGDELWAFIPTAVRPRLYKLADVNYGSNHEFFVDGTPHISDVYIGGAWRTVLIGGLGAGGKAYYALDVTTPTSPQLLWEFTDPNLGLSVAPPLVTKRSGGTWVVALSSGYNNTGDGRGHLFLLNVQTGAKLLDLSTGEGSAATPSGLGPLAAWVEADNNNTAVRYYAGDTLGNLWRFDTEGLVQPFNAAHRLAQFVVSGRPQPITTAPQLALLNSNGNSYATVFVGTGKLLGNSDLGNTDQQSIYGIKDPLTNVGYGDIRTASTLVAQDLSTVGSTRTATNRAVDWSTKAGWFVDLPDAGERIHVDMSLVYGTLVAASNVPPQSVPACANNDYGYAWLYYLNIASGSTAGQPSTVKLTDGVIVGLTTVYTSSGAKALVNYSRRDTSATDVPPPARFLPAAKKKYWRELKSR